jgi:large subunit ribosomal protein L28
MLLRLQAGFQGVLGRRGGQGGLSCLASVPTLWPTATAGRCVAVHYAPVRAKHGGKATGGSKPNRVRRGLYGGKVKQSGNHVSFSINRVRRTWRPNVHAQSLYSELLGCKLPFRATTHVLRTIDKFGGLDAYLLRTSDEKLDSDVAIETKRLLEAQLKILEKDRAGDLQIADENADASAEPRTWSAEEDAQLKHLCVTQGTHRNHWVRKSLQLGTGRTPEAVKLRWRTRLHPSVEQRQSIERRLKIERAERRIANLQERFPECDRAKAIAALRKHGDPGTSYGRQLWGRAVRDLRRQNFDEVDLLALAAASP